MGRRGAMFTRPRRRRRVVGVVTILGALVLPVLLAGLSSSPAGDASPARPGSEIGGLVPPQAADAVAVDEDGARTPQAQQPDVTPFATVGGLALSLPAESVLLVGYHEASFPESLPLGPVGHCRANENPTEAACPDADGPEYVVMSSRGRPTLGTTAVDLVLRDEDRVVSPVSGTVVDVRPYTLYGRYPDARIEIAPEGHPDLRVVLIHVREVFVRAGDVVVAGRTQLAAGPNRFPFASHVDRYFPRERWPHVHLEVKPAGAPAPS